MRVYLLTPSFPPTLGGQEKHLLELAAALIEAGAPTLVLTRKPLPGLAARETLGTVPVRRFGPAGAVKGVGLIAAPRLAIILLRMVWQLWRDRRHYDVVLVSGFNFWPFAPVLAARLTGKPCVVRPESPMEVSGSVGIETQEKMGIKPTALPLRLLNRLRAAAAARVDRFVAISAQIGEGLAGTGIERQRITHLPNGIDVARYEPVSPAQKPGLRRELGLPEQGLLVTYTGRLAHSKGVMMLIEAWGTLAAEFPHAHLAIVGSGAGCFDDCEPALRSYIQQHGLAARVTLTGTVPSVERYLKASDVFAFPSDYEGFSLSILEAMMAALPMVCTRVGVAAELEAGAAHPIGLLVAPKDPPAFRAALQRLLAEPALREQLARDARRAVQSEYSLQTEAQRYLQLFAELAGVPR